jgi:NADH-quinone oxidoreductase subunit N
MVPRSVLAQVTPFEGPPVDWYALSPLLVLVGGGIALLVLSALTPKWPKGGYAIATATIAGAALVLSFFLWDRVQDEGPIGLVGGAISVDGFSLFLTIVICGAVILTSMVADDYLHREDLPAAEPFVLMLMTAFGGIVMAGADDLVVLFLGLEVLSLALYVLAASHLRRIDSQESGLKYFVLGSFSSAFFLYGIALTYGATGTTNMNGIATFLQQNVLLENGLLLAGIALLIVGLGFKVAAAPFQAWTPDVYQGAPTPITGFMASGAKAAGFAAMLRILVVTFSTYQADWRPVVYALALLTLAAGSIFAVVQTNVKRMLAYSSINHAGFILLGVWAATPEGISSALFYLLTYAVLVVGTFAIVTLVGRTGDGHHSLDAYRGLARLRPGLSLALVLLLLAQAGVPFTSGFVAKFVVIGAAVDEQGYVLGVAAMLAAVIAAFLYLRITVSMYLAEPDAASEDLGPLRVPFATGLAIAAAVIFTVAVGLFPGPVLDFARDAVPVLGGR